MISRRGFLSGIIAAAVAPAFIRPGIIMPIKPRLIIISLPPIWWPDQVAISRFRGKTSVIVSRGFPSLVVGPAQPMRLMGGFTIPPDMVRENTVHGMTGQAAWDRGFRMESTAPVRMVYPTPRDLDPQDGHSVPTTIDRYPENDCYTGESRKPCAMLLPRAYNDIVEYEDEVILA